MAVTGLGRFVFLPARIQTNTWHSVWHLRLEHVGSGGLSGRRFEVSMRHMLVIILCPDLLEPYLYGSMECNSLFI